MFLRDKSRDIVIGLVIFIGIFLSKANILDLPYYGDELGGYIMPTHWFVEGSLFKVLPGFHPPDLFYGHPPMLNLALASLFKVFGERIWVAHLFAIGISFFGVYFTYLLGRQLFNRRTGVLAALLLFITPLYFAQSGLVHPDLMVASLGIICVYFAFKEKFIAYLLCGLCLAITKEASAAVIVAVMCYFYLTEKNNPKIWLKILNYSIPLVFLCVFYLLQKITTGMFFPNHIIHSGHSSS